MKAGVSFCVIIALFFISSFFSFMSINHLRGNARVVNYTGIVRGATQKLVKEELMGNPDDALIERLNGILAELITGNGSYDLDVLPDEEYLSNLLQLRTHWVLLKGQIMQARTGVGAEELFESSQTYFNLANETVDKAERYSEKQVRRSLTILIAVNTFFVIFIIGCMVFFVRSFALKRRAEMLDKIAYVDTLTQIPNRASCEIKLKKIMDNPVGLITIIMFDMNNLKLVNDFLGHKSGDQILVDFARILKNQLPENGFIGRYGGDEFLGIFEEASDAGAERYISKIKNEIAAYNNLFTSEIQKISFASGYASGDPRSMPLEYLINEADRRMYADKRLMKKT
jgi:diguanylate cyclase (GGDEF)-like protein